MNAYYNLFKRQWQRGKVNDSDMSIAVEKGYITEDQKKEIMKLPLDNVTE